MERFTRIFLRAISETPDESLRLLLETNLVDIHAEDDINERNCLHEAAIYGREFVLQYGLSRGVELSRLDVYGRLPLHYACLRGRVAMVQRLIEAGPETVDFRDHDNFTPLIHSIVRQFLPCVEQLLKHRAQVNPESANDHIPLNLACQHGSVEVATLLLAQGARLLADAEGLYPQHLVARSKSSQLLLLLQRHGADFNQKDKLYQWTPLFHAASDGSIECMRVLLDNNVDVDAVDEKGLKAMYYATWEGHLECMDLLWAKMSSEVRAQTRTVTGLGVLSPRRPQVPSTMEISPPAHPTEVDGIPDLSLPPPIIPLRRYGHNFLDSKTYVSINFNNGPRSIKFFNEARYPAARITVSSKTSDLIPRNIMLPIQDDSRTVSFQVDDLKTFVVDFDIFPTFGSKFIAKSVALPDIFQATESSSGSCCLPLFDPRLRSVGQITFDFQVIKPYCGTPLEITQFATYWKATSALDDQGGLVTGSSLSGDYLRLYAQLTRDGIAVCYPQFKIDHLGMQLPISYTSSRTLRDIGATSSLSSGQSLHAMQEVSRSKVLDLKQVLDNLPPSLNINIEILYPNRYEEKLMHTIFPIDINTYADAILTVVFEHARTIRNRDMEAMRSIVFSSCNPHLCTALNWKQPNCMSFHAVKVLKS